MIIYKATNIINKKVYIGATKNTLEIRKRQHIKNAFNNKNLQYFHRALLKYGTENFIWEVIDTANNTEKLKEKEIHWIKEYNAFGENGYNQHEGGYGLHDGDRGKKGEKHYLFGKHLSETTRKKISLAIRGKNNPMYSTYFYNIWIEKYGKEKADEKYIEYKEKIMNRPNPMKGKKLSEQARKNIKEGCQKRNQNGERNPFYNKKHSEEQKAKWSEKRKGIDWSKGKFAKAACKKIINLNTNEIFDSIKEAKKKYGDELKGITRTKVKYVAGYKFMLYDEYLKSIKTIPCQA